MDLEPQTTLDPPPPALSLDAILAHLEAEARAALERAASLERGAALERGKAEQAQATRVWLLAQVRQD